MSPFRAHFVEKYFGYRRLYVAHIVQQAPRRGSLAVLAEIARLGFMIAGCTLCATILWALTLSAATRATPSGPWPVVFGACALVPTIFVALSLGGLVTALRARPHVAAACRGSAHGIGTDQPACDRP